MSEPENNPKVASLRELSLLIADVVCSVPGVSGLGNAPSDSLYSLAGLSGPVKGVRISDEQELTADLYIDVDYGVKIPQLAWDIQRIVRDALTERTDRTIKSIDIHVQGVRMGHGEKND